MKSKALVFLAAWLLIAPAGTFADGCFIPPATAFAKVQIPDQRALIHFANGTETLVIDTSFQGDGTNFAWIIPVPSSPKVEPATTGLFPTMQAIFQPKVIHSVPAFCLAVIVLALFLFSVLRADRKGESVWSILAFWFFLAVFASMLLPALGTAGVAVSPSGQVQVLARKTVGVYDTATLKSQDGTALTDWLSKNGFATPTNFIPAIRAYAQEGWFFVASKIRLDASLHEPAKAHPLALTFKMQRPIYPLRLTGIGNKSCRIDLYIFGPDRAAVPNFTVERCTKPLYPATDDDGWYDRRWQRPYNVLRIRHPLLRTLVDHSSVATKLTAKLSSEQMKQDACITWSPFEEKRLTFYTTHGAAVLATNIAVSLLVMALLAWCGTAGSEGRWARGFRKSSKIVALVAIISWFPIYLLMPTIPATVAKRPEMRMMFLHKEIPSFLDSEAKESANEARSKPDLAWVRKQLEEGSPWRQVLRSDSQNNLFSGQPWHEEDSPGNYTLRQTADGIDYLWYDIDGGEDAVPLFRPIK